MPSTLGEFLSYLLNLVCMLERFQRCYQFIVSFNGNDIFYKALLKYVEEDE
jgi:hypothetical protein